MDYRQDDDQKFTADKSQLNKTASPKTAANASLHDDGMDSKALQFVGGDNDKSTQQIVTKERFWILFIFGCSTMINACGWI